MSTSKVSVRTVTYNHERFIAQAIESVLMQKTNFDYEMIIGEDCSTDNTRKIVGEYQRKHPDIIKPIFHEKNMGRRHNFLTTMRASKGKYIAILDGDDYWINPDKLQKQVDFLSAHPECSMCFHSAETVYEDGRKSEIQRPEEIKPAYKLEDILEKNFLPASSVVFRNFGFDSFPKSFDAIPFGDWPLHILNAQRGDIGYIDDTMSAYRVHEGGVWTQGGSREFDVRIEQRKGMRTFYEIINEYLDFKYDALLKRKIAEYDRDIENLSTTKRKKDVTQWKENMINRFPGFYKLFRHFKYGKEQ